MVNATPWCVKFSHSSYIGKLSGIVGGPGEGGVSGVWCCGACVSQNLSPQSYTTLAATRSLECIAFNIFQHSDCVANEFSDSLTPQQSSVILASLSSEPNKCVGPQAFNWGDPVDQQVRPRRGDQPRRVCEVDPHVQGATGRRHSTWRPAWAWTGWATHRDSCLRRARRSARWRVCLAAWEISDISSPAWAD